MWRTIAFSGAVLAVAGCGGAAPPAAARTNAAVAIRAAREVGAEQYAEAAYHLELAEEQVSRAERQIAEGRMDVAERTLERARADADLAIALTREASVRADAEDVRARIADMRERHL